MTLTQFADQLNEVLYGFPPIANESGLEGRYDMTINFTPPGAMPNFTPPDAATGEPAAPEPDGAISIFEALSGQLGLKLQSRKVKAAVLVVDHVNQTPTEN
jgi:uncharacterized protein (TIGR03435 family)